MKQLSVFNSSLNRKKKVLSVLITVEDPKIKTAASDFGATRQLERSFAQLLDCEDAQLSQLAPT